MADEEKKPAKKAVFKNSPKGKAETPAKKLPGDLVYARNEFYRDGQRQAWIVAIVSIVIALISLSMAGYVFLKGPEKHYFATTPDGKVIQMVPLNQPNMSDAAVRNWLSGSMAELFEYSHFNWQKVIDRNSSDFMTAQGKEKFILALKQSGILSAVVDRKMYSSLVVRETPTIMNKGVLGNEVLAWQFKIPVTITYRTAQNSKSTYASIVATVVRTNEVDYPNGIAISQIVMHDEKLNS